MFELNNVMTLLNTKCGNMKWLVLIGDDRIRWYPTDRLVVPFVMFITALLLA